METPPSQVGVVNGCWGLVEERGVFRNGILSEILDHLPQKTNQLQREKMVTSTWRDLEEDSNTTSGQA